MIPTVREEGASPGRAPIEVSVVMPCLNEAETLGRCVEAAQRALEQANLSGEIIVADNGSTDASAAIAQRLGARLISVVRRGYGSALMDGIAAARGKYVIIGDADESYDFSEIPRFVEKLRGGYELVQGCRFKSGGGRVLPGAMPFLHFWIGNPLFSFLARRWFHAPVQDILCGLRGFTKELFERLDQRCTGMEFAAEMIIKASLQRARILDVPVTLRPDGRRAHPPHLKTFRDGWRTLRFLLLFSPRWLFLVPGLLLIALGLLGYAIALPGLQIRGVTFDVHTLLFSSLAIICGFQSIVFAVLTKVFAISEGFLPADARMLRLFEKIDLEKGLVAGGAMMLVGLALLLTAVNQWRVRNFGPLDYSQTMRWVIPGVTLTTLGFQTLLSSFFLSVLGLKRR